MKYDQLSVYESLIGKQSVRIDIDVPGHGGRGWKRSGSSFELETQQDLDEKWKEDLSTGAKYMLQETYVKANDPHMDAKCWPVVHPWGTGSLLAEPGSGSPARYVRNRATNLESFFRRRPCRCMFSGVGRVRAVQHGA